jgi:large subunit ribosomal protein L19
MRHRLIQSVEAGHLKSDPPRFAIGDTVNVGVRITEGGKERVQPFIGVVISRRGSSTNEMFTVRRIVNDEGVERTFPLHSPKIAYVEVMRHARVRRNKLYFLRQRIGKSRKLRERRQAAGKQRDIAEPSTREKPREREMAGAV